MKYLAEINGIKCIVLQGQGEHLTEKEKAKYPYWYYLKGKDKPVDMLHIFLRASLDMFILSVMFLHRKYKPLRFYRRPLQTHLNRLYSHYYKTYKISVMKAMGKIILFSLTILFITL